MIIKSIEIEHFGCFDNQKFEFQDGFNLIYGINGKGKSTLMSFIKMMLYSKAGNEKSSDLMKNPRKKYRPWNGSPMSGAIVFEHEGCEYRLHKIFGKSPSSDTATLWNITSGEKTNLSPAYEAGDTFLKMSAAEFERSIFMDRTGGFSGEFRDFGLETKIENLSLSGDEDISQQTVRDRLSSAKEELISKSGRKGMIVELRNEISALQDKRDSLTAQINEQSALNQQIALLEAEIAKDEKLLENISRADRIQSSQNLLSAYTLLLEKHNLLKDVEEKQAQPDPQRSKVARARLSRRFIIYSSLAVLFATLFGLGLVWNKQLYALLALCVVSLLFAVSSKLSLMRMDKPADSKLILAECESTLRRDINIIAETAGISESDAFNVSHIRQKISTLSGFIEKNSPSGIEGTDSVSHEAVRKKHGALNDLYRRQVMPDSDMDEIARTISEKTTKLNELCKRYESLCLAEEVLENAISETDSGLGTFLSRRTGEYLRVMNSGKNCDVLVSETLDTELKDSTDTRYIHWRYLSQGYIDRTYFALRMAIADAHSADSTAAPLFLDDIFSQYDDESCERAMLLLKNRLETNGGQVLFFTCHKNIFDISKEVFENFGEIYI